jgi:hypothetical protein
MCRRGDVCVSALPSLALRRASRTHIQPCSTPLAVCVADEAAVLISGVRSQPPPPHPPNPVVNHLLRLGRKRPHPDTFWILYSPFQACPVRMINVRCHSSQIPPTRRRSTDSWPISPAASSNVMRDLYTLWLASPQRCACRPTNPNQSPERHRPHAQRTTGKKKQPPTTQPNPTPLTHHTNVVVVVAETPGVAEPGGERNARVAAAVTRS